MNLLTVNDLNNLIHWIHETQPEEEDYIIRIRRDLVKIAIAINGGVDE